MGLVWQLCFFDAECAILEKNELSFSWVKKKCKRVRKNMKQRDELETRAGNFRSWRKVMEQVDRRSKKKTERAGV